jgi:HrpA-like RNA helicase
LKVTKGRAQSVIMIVGVNDDQWRVKEVGKRMAMWKPGTKAPGLHIERVSDEKCDVVLNKHKHLPLTTQRQRLPIYTNRLHILYLLENYRTVVIVGETGCGKSTQIPQYLFEAGWADGGRVVACTQPRRVAAQTLAARVAEEMGVDLGKECGYTIRFDNKADAERTRVKFLTDGILLREMMGDPLLSRYSVIMVDEAHERSIYTDVVVGLLKKIQRRRKDLRVIVSSATLDAEAFKNFFLGSVCILRGARNRARVAIQTLTMVMLWQETRRMRSRPLPMAPSGVWQSCRWRQDACSRWMCTTCLTPHKTTSKPASRPCCKYT